MKIKILVIAILMMSLQTWADDVKFFKGTFKEAIEEAKKTNKLLFVDVYTKWCGPCKVVDKEVFTNDKVAALFNTNFINFKFNAEDEEGNKKELVDKYAIKSYPTFLFLMADGKVKHRSSGYGGLSMFLADAKSALGLIASFESLQLRFDAGERSNEFMREYLSAASKKIQKMREGRNEFGEKIAKITDEHLLSLPKKKWITAEYFTAVKIFLRGMGYMLENPIVSYIYENYEKFNGIVAESELAGFVSTLHFHHMYVVAQKGDINYLKLAAEIKDIPRLREFYQLTWGPVSGDEDVSNAMKRNADFTYYEAIKDWESYLNAMDEYVVAKGGMKKVNQMSFFMVTRSPIYNDSCDDPKLLRRAAEHVYNSYEAGGVHTHPSMGVDYVALMIKLGDIDAAKDMAKKVEVLVKKYGEAGKKEYSDKIDAMLAEVDATQKQAE